LELKVVLEKELLGISQDKVLVTVATKKY